MENPRAYAFMVSAVIFVMVGGCGLDSESLFVPIILVLVGIACGITAMAIESMTTM